MNQVSFLSFALRAQSSSRGGVNPNPVGGPSGAGGPSVCTTKKRRKPRPVDQLPLPLDVIDHVHGRLSFAGLTAPGWYDYAGDYINAMDAPDHLPSGSTRGRLLPPCPLFTGGRLLVDGHNACKGWLS